VASDLALDLVDRRLQCRQRIVAGLSDCGNGIGGCGGIGQGKLLRFIRCC
jgi:hypothetical protein